MYIFYLHSNQINVGQIPRIPNFIILLEDHLSCFEKIYNTHIRLISNENSIERKCTVCQHIQ